jgi:transposase
MTDHRMQGGVVEARETVEDGPLVSRVAALDIAKASLVACVRVPHETRSGRRVQTVRECATLTPALLGLADWLRVEQVELVGMEATGDYWKPVYYLLEAEGFEVWLLNPKHVKNVPGRPKTDRLDAVWLAKLLERGMVRPSLVQPKPVRQLRDLARYRRSVVRDRSREVQRLQDLLEDAQIKLSSVISDVMCVSGREMIEALIAGQRDPKVLAQMARGPMRAKVPVLREALTGHFEDHHGFLAAAMLARIDAATATEQRVTNRIEEMIEPFRHQVDQLIAIPGIKAKAAQELIAEIGVDMSRFPTADHLAAWARFAPVDRQSANRAKQATTGKGNPWLGATLGEIVAAIARTDTFLGERYRRLARRRGKQRAIVAVGRSVLVIVWHLLSDPDVVYQDLGPDYYHAKINRRRRERDLTRQLENLTGQRVVLTPRPEQAA